MCDERFIEKFGNVLLVDALRSVSYKDDSNWTCILLNFNQAFSLLELNVMLELI